jgi:hypothetical protein
MDPHRPGKGSDVLSPQVLTLDMTADDEATIRLRLVHEVPAVVEAGARYVVLDLGARDTLRSGLTGTLAGAHRDLRAVKGRLVVVTSPHTAIECARVCPDLLLAATTRQAFAALGLAPPRPMRPTASES